MSAPRWAREGELSVNTDYSGPALFVRQPWAGLDAGFGQISIGRQYAPSFIATTVIGSAFCDGLYGGTNSVTPNVGGKLNLWIDRSHQSDDCDTPSYQPRHEIRLGACAQMSPKRPLSVH